MNRTKGGYALCPYCGRGMRRDLLNRHLDVRHPTKPNAERVISIEELRARLKGQNP